MLLQELLDDNNIEEDNIIAIVAKKNYLKIKILDV
jgi:hypothetical protein